ncbi:MAG: bifunctional 2-C-methyl-D-erythritol 4-phosphate cytidylyltransferase/2-C-methyl-D-erythritol 2,4-cyclodiphosphate synthase [Alphaproteobacteria bacterium]|nr:bifunctional 2-C-methyl-D-erythritol 4-phosphate cytidylyltransferase/2-C-methyl-D-erythritol 2,4-cyclodiphosphate synthase [Alphaproteobacteria bacterium]
MRIAALIMAAGKGVRAGAGLPKQYRKIAGRALLRHTLDRFCHLPEIGSVQVIINPDDEALYNAAVEGLPLAPPIAGGDSRQESVRLGLEALADQPPDIVLIHDAARPFVDAATLQAVIAALAEAEGAIAAVPVTDSVKLTEGRNILKGIQRDGLWRALTPQGFHFQAILEAHRKARGLQMTDDASVAEHAGMTVRLVQGNEDNFKITHEEDFSRAERLLSGGKMLTRMGMGYDVHRFEAGDAIILCGVEIPHFRKLAGHSDADVGLHALTDAILGAMALGDIGQHFPPSDPQWKGAPSDIFLKHAAKLVRAAGGEIINLDVTLICEAPRIAPHRMRMQQRIEEILELPPGRVSVKATTTEGLGFAGRGEGIAAQAIAAIRAPA